MDIWSLNEMEECRTVLYKGVGSLEVALRYAEFGGVIRQVLAKPESSFAELERNLGAQTSEKLLSMESLGRREKVSHSFAHIRVSRPIPFFHFSMMIILAAGKEGQFYLLHTRLSQDLPHHLPKDSQILQAQVEFAPCCYSTPVPCCSIPWHHV